MRTFSEWVKAARKMAEDSVPANNTGTGNIAGMGVGPQGEPGKPPGLLFGPLFKRWTPKKKGQSPVVPEEV